ncbi:hypothetical protein BRSU_0408 [Brachyspira suanatina]|uniref:Uncharacterized protein n=1 Tax=Brachyspira suanatina TaxID=381802 RepID=A0A0G4K436_9SPIR|nr:hypothetical protein [Brachyspira suanatina]CRF31839.1 hypothetical protein BRSU_0408 [Brachyspira suanatina]
MIFLNLLPYIAISFLLGIIIKFLKHTNIINNICFNVMNYSKLEYDEIYVYVSTYIYWLFIIIFAVIISIRKEQNILSYLIIDKKYIIYIFINIFAIISSFELIISILSLISIDIKNNIFKNVLLIPYISSLYYLKGNNKWTLIMLESIIKSIFFNGVLYFTIKKEFNEYNIFTIIFIICLLSILEEILRLNSIKQFLILTIICFFIIFINGIIIEYTKSLIPSVLATTFFSIYYIGHIDNMLASYNKLRY